MFGWTRLCLICSPGNEYHIIDFFRFFTINEIPLYLTSSGFSLIKIEQYRETDRIPNGRPEVEWILALEKISSVAQNKL
jgi:hypothetical protein